MVEVPKFRDSILIDAQETRHGVTQFQVAGRFYYTSAADHLNKTPERGLPRLVSKLREIEKGIKDQEQHERDVDALVKLYKKSLVEKLAPGEPWKITQHPLFEVALQRVLEDKFDPTSSK